MIRATLDGLDRVGERIVCGQNDDLRIWPLGLDLVEHLQSFGVRQLQIEKNERGRFVFQRVQSSSSSAGGLGFESVPAQQRFEREQDRSFVINDQDSSSLFHRDFSGGRVGRVSLVTKVEVL